MTHPVHLTTNEAIVLQQVHEDGEDDMHTLARQLGLSRSSLFATVERLKHKGLIAITSSTDELWVHLTRKGQQFIHYVWPEATGRFAAA